MDRASIRLHWSWAPALGVLVWSLASDHFPGAGFDDRRSVAAAIVVAIGAVVSVVARTTARRFAAGPAKAEGRGSILWPSGAVAEVRAASAPPVEVRILAAGLFMSLALAAVLEVIARSTASSSVAETAEVLSRFNAAIGIFNLIPALPLDAGAFARSISIARGASIAHATATFARAGMVFGAILAAVGGLRIAAGDTSSGVGVVVAGAVTAGAATACGWKGTPRARDRSIVRRSFAGAAFAIAMLVPAATLYHPPLSLLSPGEPLAVLEGVTIRGVPTSPINGRYIAASVEIQDPTALHAFVGLFREGTRLVRRSHLPPVIEDPFRERGAAASFEGSRLFAAAAAARSVGLDVVVGGTGVRIRTAGPYAASSGMQSGDVIVSVYGRPVSTLLDLRDAVGTRQAGTEFTLGIERAGRPVEARIRSRTERRSGRVPGINADMETRDLKIDLPFEIVFPPGEEAGPSGGLAYALAFADLLDPRDIAAGRTIAATGVMHLTGQADPIIGVVAKVGSARMAGASVFLVSEGDARLLERAELPVIGVRSLIEAIRRLTQR